jgi:hypothetical protein
MRALRTITSLPNRREDAGPFMVGKGGRLTAILDAKGIAYAKPQLLA